MTKAKLLIQKLLEDNKKFITKRIKELKKHVSHQSPKIAILTCSDSRVIPEYIFNKSIGEIFVVRVIGNVATDRSVIGSLEYAVDQINVELLIIMGHTDCGAVKAAENENNSEEILDEIRKSFSKNPENHIIANIKHQIDTLPKKSNIISKAIKEKKINLIGALYHLDTGLVEFL